MLGIDSRRIAIAGATLALMMGPSLRASEPIDPARFETLHRTIQPRPDEEQWLQIPWETSLWEARRKASAKGKPILLWEMDGNPLGCT
ncbi:hypothetical protein [Tautonia marina]|uniref:hypothetical protein n=1 Tax=Tautonia marina TaxID=2653855 RepID=UPI00126088C4|nr:hypothetical protein [Tautonia marina]